MGLGGGTWLTQNKILPGAYIIFVSAARANATLSDRGIATVPIEADWGPVGEVVEVTTRDFQRNSKRLFGYDFTHPKLKGLRDLFQNVRLVYTYRLGGADGIKATDPNGLAEAMFEGERGNLIHLRVVSNIDEPGLWDVSTYFDNNLVETQTVALASELEPNGFVNWRDVPLTAMAISQLQGGVNPTISNANYQAYLDAVESYSFNAIGCLSSDNGVKMLFAAFTKRMREEHGVKFQCVVYDHAADHEGIVNVKNKSVDANEYSLVWWTTGIVAGTAVNRSATNRVYSGEFTVDTNFTQPEYERAIQNGFFAFYRVNSSEVRVLRDINSLVNLTADKGEDFQQNQTIRVIDQIANDIALLFNTRYLGIIPNDEDGRISLWSDIVQHHNQLQTIRAIENFSPDDVIVEEGDTKRAVLVTDAITPVNAMEKLYMTVSVA